MIETADQVIDLGPGAVGRGQSVTGDVAGLRWSGTLPGSTWTTGPPAEAGRATPRPPSITGATLHNLQDVERRAPPGRAHRGHRRGRLGKSSLVHGSLGAARRDHRRAAPHPRCCRSNAASYTGLLDPIRAFSKANGVKAALFSANSRAPARTAKASAWSTDLDDGRGGDRLRACEGRRFTPEVLSYKLSGKDISEVWR